MEEGHKSLRQEIMEEIRKKQAAKNKAAQEQQKKSNKRKSSMDSPKKQISSSSSSPSKEKLSSTSKKLKTTTTITTTNKNKNKNDIDINKQTTNNSRHNNLNNIPKMETTYHATMSNTVEHSPNSDLVRSSSESDHHTCDVGTGCLMCRKDDDHANLLLCESCNDEYHTYCLEPPLMAVPEFDFYCDKCKPLHDANKDGLDYMVNALPPSFTERFGEIIWAAGGVGFGWWPACIYDPRLTVGGARQLARKNIGKKHLVYFFECHDAPFTVLPDAKVIPWEDGLIEELDTGKTARSMGKNRLILFEQALQAARNEYDKPVECRLDWNHEKKEPSPPKTTSTTSTKSLPTSNANNNNNNLENNKTTQNEIKTTNDKKKAKKSSSIDSKERENSSSERLPFVRRSGRTLRLPPNNNDLETRELESAIEESKEIFRKTKMIQKMIEAQEECSNEQEQLLLKQVANDEDSAIRSAKIETITKKRKFSTIRSNFNAAVKSLSSSSSRGVAIVHANSIEPTEDRELFCKILCRVEQQPSSINHDTFMNSLFTNTCVNIGFISLPSQKHSTFALVRQTIKEDFDDDCIPPNESWKFYVPNLGPMSVKQEQKLGPILNFLQGTTSDSRLGDGSISNPLKIVIHFTSSSKRKYTN